MTDIAVRYQFTSAGHDSINDIFRSHARDARSAKRATEQSYRAQTKAQQGGMSATQRLAQRVASDQARSTWG